MYTIKARIRSSNLQKVKLAIREEAGAIVLKHALGMATALYQIYPVGPESAHKDGSPHTRDTFALVITKGGATPNPEDAIAGKGHFESASKKFIIERNTKLSFIAGGASRFLEWGTIYMEPLVLIRPLIKRVNKDITDTLRQIKLSLAR